MHLSGGNNKAPRSTYLQWQPSNKTWNEFQADAATALASGVISSGSLMLKRTFGVRTKAVIRYLVLRSSDIPSPRAEAKPTIARLPEDADL